MLSKMNIALLRILNCNLALVSLAIVVSSVKAQCDPTPHSSIRLPDYPGVSIRNETSDSGNFTGFDPAATFLDAETCGAYTPLFTSPDSSGRLMFSPPIDSSLLNLLGLTAARTKVHVLDSWNNIIGQKTILYPEVNDGGSSSLTSRYSLADNDSPGDAASTLMTAESPVDLTTNSIGDDSSDSSYADSLVATTSQSSRLSTVTLAGVGWLCWLWLSHRRKKYHHRFGVRPR